MSLYGVGCEANKNGFEKIQDYQRRCEGFEPIIKLLKNESYS